MSEHVMTDGFKIGELRTEEDWWVWVAAGGGKDD